MNHDQAIYHKILLLMMRSKQHLVQLVQAADLSVPQGLLLMILDAHEGKSMHELAKYMSCDASNITGLVDKLDAHELIVKTSAAHDRRIKCIQLSPKGAQLQQQLLSGLHGAETLDTSALSPAERQTLLELIDKLLSQHRG